MMMAQDQVQASLRYRPYVKGMCAMETHFSTSPDHVPLIANKYFKHY